mgnify:CR=1 FL=1
MFRGRHNRIFLEGALKGIPVVKEESYMEQRYISKVKPLSQYILQVDFVSDSRLLLDMKLLCQNNHRSCVFVPEGTVPGWAVDTETGNGEFSNIAGIWYLDGDADAITKVLIQRRCSIRQATRTSKPLDIQYFQGFSYVYGS